VNGCATGGPFALERSPRDPQQMDFPSPEIVFPGEDQMLEPLVIAGGTPVQSNDGIAVIGRDQVPSDGQASGVLKILDRQRIGSNHRRDVDLGDGITGVVAVEDGAGGGSGRVVEVKVSGAVENVPASTCS